MLLYECWDAISAMISNTMWLHKNQPVVCYWVTQTKLTQCLCVSWHQIEQSHLIHPWSLVSLNKEKCCVDEYNTATAYLPWISAKTSLQPENSKTKWAKAAIVIPCLSFVDGCCIVPLNLMTVVVHHGSTSQTELSLWEMLVPAAPVWHSWSKNPSENASPMKQRWANSSTYH